MELKDSILEKTIEIVWFLAKHKSEQERSDQMISWTELIHKLEGTCFCKASRNVYNFQ